MSRLHDDFLSVSRELRDVVRAVIAHPDVALTTVGIDLDPMRSDEHRVALVPALDELAVAIHDVEDASPFGMALWIVARQVVPRCIAAGHQALGDAQQLTQLWLFVAPRLTSSATVSG